MDRIEPLWELVRNDRAVRWSAYASVAIVWLAVAWAAPTLLVLLPLVAGGTYLFRRRRAADGSAGDPDDDLNLL